MTRAARRLYVAAWLGRNPWREGLWPCVVRIAFRQDQEPTDAAASFKHEPEVGRAFGLPAFLGESADSGGHGAAQVGAGFQALAVNDFPLQVEDNYVARGFALGVDVVVVAGHAASFAKR